MTEYHQFVTDTVVVFRKDRRTAHIKDPHRAAQTRSPLFVFPLGLSSSLFSDLRSFDMARFASVLILLAVVASPVLGHYGNDHDDDNNNNTKDCGPNRF